MNQINNEWVPIQWLRINKVIIAKYKDVYKSTEDSGKTWRESTEGEILESGWME